MSLKEGIGYTYPWIEAQVKAKLQAAEDEEAAARAMVHSLSQEAIGVASVHGLEEGSGRSEMMRLQTVRAVYKDGTLVFADPELAPGDGTEVVVTFLEKFRTRITPEIDPVQALRGRGKGERLVERLLQSRREDRQRDERSYGHLRA